MLGTYQWDPRYRPRKFAKMAKAAQVDGDTLAHGMGIITAPTGRTRRWIPEFVSNAAQLRSVIIHVACSYVFHAKEVPADVQVDLGNLKRLADNRLAAYQALADGSSNAHWNKVAEHLRAVAEAGGFLEMVSGISYRAWRLKWHDKEIAEQMGLKKHTARDILGRMVEMANRLGYPTYKPRSDARMRVSPEVVAAMWGYGASVGLIAAILSYHPERVRAHLRKAGLFVFGRGKGAKPRGTYCKKCGAAYVPDGKNQKCPDCTRKRLNAWHRAKREREFIKSVAWG